MKISKIKSAEILDSRARPTICTSVYLDDGSIGQAMVPSGHLQVNLKHSN